MRANVTKLESLEKQHKAAKAKNDSLKAQVRTLRKHSPKSSPRPASHDNEPLRLQVEALNLQIIDLTQAAKDARARHASDTASLKADVASLKAQLSKARQQSEVTTLRMTLSKLRHQHAKAQQKADAADAFMLFAGEWRDKLAGKQRD